MANVADDDAAVPAGNGLLDVENSMDFTVTVKLKNPGEPWKVIQDATVIIDVFVGGMGRVMAYDSLDDDGEPVYFFASGIDQDTKFDEGSSVTGLLGISWFARNYANQGLNDSGLVLEEDESQVVIIFESEEEYQEADCLICDARCDLDLL